MATRLPWETKAGEFSEPETFLQLLEHLRLAAEACYGISHFRKANEDAISGQMFLVFGQALESMVQSVTRTAMRDSHRLKS